jgi:asparagine synthase (glutamine-hydrolysing)
MCGIAGIFCFRSLEAKGYFVEKMTNAMVHRGPDADGFFEAEELCMGHRRLSIIDLSDAAKCPFTENSGRFVLVFNGEIYNFHEVKKQLKEYHFRTSGDTEVLAAAFAQWGPDCVTRFKGMFAFAIWDKRDKKLTICRDRMGVKPLYYFHNEKVFIFASEIRAILASGLVPAKLDYEALSDYLAFQSFGYPSSPIRNILQLEAGSYMSIEREKVTKRVYWRLGQSECLYDFSNPMGVKKRIRELLRDSIERRLVSDVPIGSFLSGGIDSSIVAGLMAEVSDRTPVTFNITFEEKEFDESIYAEAIARKFGTDHHKIQLRPESFLEELDNALSSMDTPSADGINTYVVSKAIRNAGIAVALSGVGGDELFGGYPFFKRFLKLQKFSSIFRATRLLRSLSSSVLGSTGSGKNDRIAAMLSAPDFSIASLYPEFRRVLTPGQLSRLTRLNANGRTRLETELVNHADIFNRLPLLSQVSAAEYIGYTQNTLLKDTDQMSMAVSLEVREPFFDHDLVEFMLHVPDRLKYPVYSKSLLVESVKPMLPDEVVHRKKQGFLFPWDLWMKRELQTFCTTLIDRVSKRDFINGPELHKYWMRFLKGDKSVRWTELWLFIVLEYWMEKNQVED